MRSRSTSDTTSKSERGVTLVWVAGMLVALLGVSAFAVDLGWLYLNTSRLQKAADSAALAGVVNLPSSPAQAAIDAQAAASANKFPIGTPVTNTFAGNVIGGNKYEVTLGTSVSTFFLKVLGINSFQVSREATAQYVLPVPMGSPSACFGVGNSGILAAGGLNHCAGFTQNFWAAINGRYTAKVQGDPYMVSCITATAPGACSGNNPEIRPTGYNYAIEVPSGATSMTVKIYDAGFYDRATPQTETGDTDGLGGSVSGGPRMVYQLRQSDTTPHDPLDNAAIVACRVAIDPESNSATYKNRWYSLCTVNNPTPNGIYVLQVSAEGNQGGNNSYAVGVTVVGSANQARVYGINDMSLFTNGNTGTAVVYLAEIKPVHAGKKLELRFFDPGENPSGTAYIGVRRPDGTRPNCTWTAVDEGGAQTASGSGACRIQTTNSGTAIFNGEWITATIDIPSNYTCTSDCFWKMELDLNGSQDRTTWTARVIGNPVRLVPNAP